MTGKSNIEDILKMFPNMIITKGEEGVFYCDESGKICHEDSVKCANVVETNGVGDTFIGNFVVFRQEKRSLKESIRRSMCASTLEIQKMGVLNAMPYREQTNKLYKVTYKG